MKLIIGYKEILSCWHPLIFPSESHPVTLQPSASFSNHQNASSLHSNHTHFECHRLREDFFSVNVEIARQLSPTLSVLHGEAVVAAPQAQPRAPSVGMVINCLPQGLFLPSASAPPHPQPFVASADKAELISAHSLAGLEMINTS